MRGIGIIVLALAVGTCVCGCKSKQPTLEEMQEPLSMEELGTVKTEMSEQAEAPVATEAGSTEVAVSGTTQPLETLPPAGPYKPSSIEIQTALKNAGYYSGPIDGKVGPMTKKAIEEFQKANNLNPDAKVGTKTWVVLSKYLEIATPVKGGKKRR